VCSSDLAPLGVVIHKPLLDRITSFFLKPILSMDSATRKDLRRKAEQQVQEISEKTRLTFQEQIAARTKIQLDINIHAPNLIIPEDITQKDPLLLVANFGVLSIKTEDVTSNSDHFKISMKSLQLGFINSNNTKLSLVEKFDINLAVELQPPKIVTPTNIGKRALKIWTNLPLLKLSLSGFKLTKLREILQQSFLAPKTVISPSGSASPSGHESKSGEDEVLPSQPKNRNPLPSVLLWAEINSTFQSIVISLEKDLKPLVNIEVSQIRSSIRLSQKDIRVVTGLSAFLVTDMTNETYPPLATSNCSGDASSQDLIQMGYCKRLDEGIENKQTIEISFNTLHLTFNRVTILSLMQWINTIQSKQVLPPKEVPNLPIPEGNSHIF